MDFNFKKSQILLFNCKSKLPHYLFHGHELEIVESDMKFTAHIHRKLMTANQPLSMIKRALYWPPTNAKLFAYKNLCLPYLEYSRKDISDIEQLQDQPV